MRPAHAVEHDLKLSIRLLVLIMSTRMEVCLLPGGVNEECSLHMREGRMSLSPFGGYRGHQAGEFY